MLRQVSLAIEVPSSAHEIARKYGAEIAMIDCKDFNSKGMTMLIDVAAPKEKMARVIEELRETSHFKKLYVAQSGRSRSLCVAVLDRPPICQAVLDSGVLCVTCPYNGDGGETQWKFLVRDSDNLKSLLSRLEREKIPTEIRDVSDVSNDDELTPRQREILGKAIALGFYEFPRRIDLTSLSREVNVKPSTLSEILRNAERKILAHYSEPYLLGRKATQGF